MTYLATLIKDHWPIVTALTLLFGFVFAAVNYYARAEAETLIEIKMEKPLQNLNKKYNFIEERTKDIDDTVKELQYEQRRQNDVTNEKFKNIEDKLDNLLRQRQ